MNKPAIKNFAITARRKLIASIQERLKFYQIQPNNSPDPTKESETYKLPNNQFLTESENQQRNTIIQKITEQGYDLFIEEVAYTWFNRILAIRFMEVNDYLPFKTRVLSSEILGKSEPDIITNVYEFLDDLSLNPEKVEIYITQNEPENLYRHVFLKVCNSLGEILPNLFESLEDYTELLLPNTMILEDSVIQDLINIIPEENFNIETGGQIEIIGWLYQYYNTEPKEKVINIYKGNVKKSDIPVATQLFTTDWVVKYMVENSLGKYYLDRNPNSPIKNDFKYLMPELKSEKITYEDVPMESIKVLDNAMGSGHILVYAFEILMKMYEEKGYSQRDAVKLILEHNIYGLEIDKRAHQLAYFSLMMKARQYDRRFLTRGIEPMVYEFIETTENIEHLINAQFSNGKHIFDSFKNAKELGSIIKVDWTVEEVDSLLQVELTAENAEFYGESYQNLLQILKIAKVMAQKYEAVITNPPYLNKFGLGLKAHLTRYFNDVKTDLFSVFVKNNSNLLIESGYASFMTPNVWLFLSSYETLRKFIVEHMHLKYLIHFEHHAYYSEAHVPICTFVIKNTLVQSPSSFIRLVDFLGGGMPIQKMYAEKAMNDPSVDYFHSIDLNILKAIPELPFAYWLSKKALAPYLESKPLIKEIASPKAGLTTGDNNIYQRYWYEVSSNKIGYGYKDISETEQGIHKWFPCNSGSEFRRWSIKKDIVVNWEFNGKELKSFKNASGKLASRPQNTQFYFKEGITWNKISTALLGVKFKVSGAIFDDTSRSAFPTKKKDSIYIIGLMNSVVTIEYLKALNPTMSFTNGDIQRIPYVYEESRVLEVESLVQDNIKISKEDLDSFETSWDFTAHPFVTVPNSGRLLDSFSNWEAVCASRFENLKQNEEELNRIFIDIYGLQEELTPEVEDKYVSISLADATRDAKSFVSYLMGILMGRYSVDTPGLAFAGGAIDFSNFETFKPDKDGILMLTDTEYFEDDIMVRIKELLGILFGPETIEENMEWLTTALGVKGNLSPDELLRKYLMTDFMKDHVQTYKKRPIYWLFQSGKLNGFKALVYMHRYDDTTIAKLRTDYLHPLERKYEGEIQRLDNMLAFDSITPSEKNNATKLKQKVIKQLDECRAYDLIVKHLADLRVGIDLDDGVKVNYQKFQDIKLAETSSGKAVTGNLLYPIKM